MEENKKIPLLYDRKEKCCGCGACVSVCLMDAIGMMEDNEGFSYPVIAVDNCIGCQQCVKVCPYGEVMQEK